MWCKWNWNRWWDDVDNVDGVDDVRHVDEVAVYDADDVGNV